MIIVADFSPLFSFAILDKLDLLDRIFDNIKILESVYDEIIKNERSYSKKMKEFALNKTQIVKDKLAVQILQKDLDLVESEVIVLAKENKIYNILIDEYIRQKNYQRNWINFIRISNDLYVTAIKIADEK